MSALPPVQLRLTLEGNKKLIANQEFLLVCVVLQHCKIYLCGTKSDLIIGDKSLRQIDYHDAQDFAEGNQSVAVRKVLSRLCDLHTY